MSSDASGSEDLPWPEQESANNRLDNNRQVQSNQVSAKRPSSPPETTTESLFSRPRILNSPNSVSAHSQTLNYLTSDRFTLCNPNKLRASDCKQPLKPLLKPHYKPCFTKNAPPGQPPVTTVLQETMSPGSRYILDRWMASMIQKLGLEGFVKYRKEMFSRAKGLHVVLANYFLGSGEPNFDGDIMAMNPYREVLRNLWNSLRKVVRNNINNVRLVEHIVAHDGMKYRGIVDCVAFYNDELVVIDFKTAEKPKKTIESLYDNPLQVTAYCGAINHDQNIANDVIDRNICSGVIIVAYVDGSEATIHYFSPNQVENNYWKEWKERLDQYFRLESISRQQTEDQLRELRKKRKL